MHSRRDFLKSAGVIATAAATVPAQAAESAAPLTVDSKPRYELSPYLYMQFMEPLGTTDGSVSAAWDFSHDRWRPDVVDITKELSPSLLRWGGCFASYYRWKEAVGPRDQRVPMMNMCWGGLESNQIGTQEFVDFCTQVGADPLMCVNFESDGKAFWEKDPKGSVRKGDAKEAAEWVSFCNRANDKQREKLGVDDRCRIPLWQIGNETSYNRTPFGCDDRKKAVEIAARKTVEFALAMRKVDPSIKLIGWGDSGWAPRMLEMAGEHLQYISFHHMFNPDRGVKDSPLQGTAYRLDPARTWEHLMNARDYHEKRIQGMREEVGDSSVPLALTECHFALPGRNRCEVLSSWAAGVANARLLNVHERHGDRLKIATLADFCGTRWQVNAVMIPVPHGRSFLMPVALVMKLYRRHTGKNALHVEQTPDGLDVTASRTGNRVFLHVVNTQRTAAVGTSLSVAGQKIASGKVFEMSADPEFEVLGTRPNEIPVVERVLPETAEWRFPPASVSAVELTIDMTST